MFFFLSKLLAFLFLPIGVLLILLIISYNINNRTKVKRLIFISILLTYLASIDFTSMQLYRYWIKDVSFNNQAKADAGVVLTGGLFLTNYGPKSLVLGSSADRIWQALRLYKEKSINKIIVTGGDTGIFQPEKTTESILAHHFLIENGVKSEDIILENKAKNTFENAKNVKLLLRQHPEIKSLVLFTSGYHMPRAMACFQYQGLNVVAYGQSPLGPNKKLADVYDFIPSAKSVAHLELLLKEITGYIIYKIVGYC